MVIPFKNRAPDENVDTFPLCFASAADFELWRAVPYRQLRGCSVCTDCLPQYQLRMKKLGRCEHPETMFTLTEDGEIIGRGDTA